MTPERDEIEEFLIGMEKYCDQEYGHRDCEKLLALVRCYQEAIQDELKRCGGTVPILKAALKKAKEIIK